MFSKYIFIFKHFDLATVYGCGVYFATQSSYSHRYAKADANGKHSILLAEVITGEFCQGNKNMRFLPKRPSTNEDYDSAVDNVQSPTMFVVFKDAGVYPLYLLEYR